MAEAVEKGLTRRQEEGKDIFRMDRPVDPGIVTELLSKFDDFRRAYETDGLPADAFDTFGPTVKTLRQFINGYESLAATIRDFMLPDPGIKP